VNFKTHLIYNITITAVATMVAETGWVHSLIGHDSTNSIKNYLIIFSTWAAIITMIAALYSTIKIANYYLNQSANNAVQITVAGGVAFFSLILSLVFSMGYLM